MDSKELAIVSMAVIIAPALVAQRQIDRRMAPPSNALSVEAESLVASAQTTQGQAGVQNMQGFAGGWSGGAQLFWAVPQAGAELRLSFPATVPARLEIFLHFTRAPDFAIVRAQIDDAAPVTFNGYSPTVTRDRVLLGTRVLPSGAHQLRLTVTSKDGKSAGFNVGLDRIEFQPVADEGTPRNRPADDAQASGAAVATTIPLLHVTAGDMSADDSPSRQTIAPLSMRERIEITRKTLASTSMPLGEPGTPLRLSAGTPQVGLSGLRILNGVFETRSGKAYITVTPGARLDFTYDPVEANRAHLLECGCHTSPLGAKIRLSSWIPAGGPKQSKFVELATFSFVGEAPHRLVTVVVPTESHFSMTLDLAQGNGFSVLYCDLTPFK